MGKIKIIDDSKHELVVQIYKSPNGTQIVAKCLKMDESLRGNSCLKDTIVPKNNMYPYDRTWALYSGSCNPRFGYNSLYLPGTGNRDKDNKISKSSFWQEDAADCAIKTYTRLIEEVGGLVIGKGETLKSIKDAAVIKRRNTKAINDKKRAEEEALEEIRLDIDEFKHIIYALF